MEERLRFVGHLLDGESMCPRRGASFASTPSWTRNSSSRRRLGGYPRHLCRAPGVLFDDAIHFLKQDTMVLALAFAVIKRRRHMKKALLAGVMLLALPSIASAQVVIITGGNGGWGPGWGGPGPWGPPGPVFRPPVHPGWGNVGWGGCGGGGCGGWGGGGVVVVVPGGGGGVPYGGYGYGHSYYGSSVNYYEGGYAGW
jgi:hypothetical protein